MVKSVAVQRSSLAIRNVVVGEALEWVRRASDRPPQTRFGWFYSEEIALLGSLRPGESSGAAYLTEEGRSSDHFKCISLKTTFGQRENWILSYDSIPGYLTHLDRCGKTLK